MKRNLAVRLVNVGQSDVVFLLHTDRAPSPTEWSEAIALGNDYAARGDVRRLRVLSITDGGGPRPRHARTSREILSNHHHTPKVAASSRPASSPAPSRQPSASSTPTSKPSPPINSPKPSPTSTSR